MFLHNGWQVTLRESPGLVLGLHGDVLYAEVKRFCEKKQDRLNERLCGCPWRSDGLLR